MPAALIAATGISAQGAKAESAKNMKTNLAEWEGATWKASGLMVSMKWYLGCLKRLVGGCCCRVVGHVRSILSHFGAQGPLFTLGYVALQLEFRAL